MSGKIQVLDDQTINQIAAGEVIENPASVVKELVENSLDAGATEVTVEIRAGGRQLIRITDNGTGMSSEDALLSLERHATSKIRGLDDIYDVHTMGFRGEAVPSIASVSKLTILTRSADEPKGTLITVEGGKVCDRSSVERDPGTTMEVASLFFNVPVRKKFQRSPTYDANEVHKVLSSLALARTDVRFTLINQGKTVLKTTDNNFKTRVEEVLGKEFSCGLCPLSMEKNRIKLEGMIGLPHFNRHNRTGQHLLINGRAVFSPLISFAVKEGYGTSMGAQRHPVFVLKLTLPGQLVDVNVHPQKKEVRLRQSQELKEIIIEAVEKALSKETVPETTVETSFAQAPAFTYSPPPEPVHFPKDWMLRETVEEPMKKMETAPLFTQEPETASPSVLATIPGYILTKAASDKLQWISVRNAHARVLYDTLNKSYLPAIPVQQLLIPLNFDFSTTEAATIKSHLETLEKWGVGIREFGPNSFAIDALPQLWEERNLEELLHAIAKEEAEVSLKDKKHLVKTVVSSAFSSNKKLSNNESQTLVNQLYKTQNPHFCPLGKPTCVEIVHDEIAKLFHT